MDVRVMVVVVFGLLVAGASPAVAAAQNPAPDTVPT
ncbi:MAG: hypothetical protein V7607_5219, partial [Solirubrobacteraceae bacterium]